MSGPPGTPLVAPNSSGPQAPRAAGRRVQPFLPPFVETRATHVDRAGFTWVARSFRAADRDRVYDVFDDKGVLARRVTVKNGRRSRRNRKGRHVYVVTRDEDDVQWIERYAPPGSDARARPVPGSMKR